MKFIPNMKFIDSVNIEIETFTEKFHYPLDYYWIFTACDEEWGNNHVLCLEDYKFRDKYNGHCVCGCHR